MDRSVTPASRVYSRHPCWVEMIYVEAGTVPQLTAAPEVGNFSSNCVSFINSAKPRHDLSFIHWLFTAALLFHSNNLS